jgi:hypothetical protein
VVEHSKNTLKLKLIILIYFQSKSIKKKHQLFTQNSLLAETPLGSPEEVLISPKANKTGRKKARTQIVKKNSLIIALQPPPSTKENFGAAKSVAKKTLEFKEPLSVQNGSQRPKRLVKSLCISRRSSFDFMALPSKGKRQSIVALTPKDFVLSSCQYEDIGLAQQLVKRLAGKAFISTFVGPSTTHVIVGDERRTLNVLRVSIWGRVTLCRATHIT